MSYKMPFTIADIAKPNGLSTEKIRGIAYDDSPADDPPAPSPEPEPATTEPAADMAPRPVCRLVDEVLKTIAAHFSDREFDNITLHIVGDRKGEGDNYIRYDLEEVFIDDDKRKMRGR